MRKFLKPKSILLFFIGLNLVIGVLIVSDYSRSTDEGNEGERSSAALAMYVSNYNEFPITQMLDLGPLRYYGTAVTTLIRAVERFAFPEMDHRSFVVAHYGYFLFYQVTVVCIFFLGNYFLENEWYSLCAAVLFGTQPLLYGHAFLNPKDIPIMGMFSLTILLGFRMVDQWQKAESPLTLEEAEESGNARSRSRFSNKEMLFIIILLVISAFIWAGGLIVSLVVKLITLGYQSQGGVIGRLFASITTSGSLEGYQLLGFSRVFSVLRTLYMLIPVGLLALFIYARRHKLFNQYINLSVLLAAFIWGVAVSTRIIAVAAGGIVGLYALLILQRRAFFPLVIYTLTAMIISFVSWPYLWMEGLGGYFQSLTVFSDYPWSGYVLFEGQTYLPKELPSSYILKSMAIGFTEPLVILAVSGVVIALFLLFRSNAIRIRLSLVIFWLLLPVLYVVSFHPTLYQGFRHLFFIIPPLFIFAGLAFQVLAKKLKSTFLISVVAVLILLPGVIGLVTLHPFQAMYFNSFIGGIKGAENSYHIPYMNTGYKLAMEYINENTPPKSDLLFWKEDLFGRLYADEGYSFSTFNPGDELELSNYDYAVLPANALDQSGLGGYPVFYTVEAGGVALVYVLDLAVP